MKDGMYWACAELITLGTQLPQAQNLPSADVLQRRIGALLDEMSRRAKQAGFLEEDVTDARYALIAFIDEQALRSSWPGRQQWISQPLQLTYLNENTAGEGFFLRLQSLQREPHRAAVLEIFYLCLALGFQGQYAVRRGEGLAALIESVGSQIGRTLPPADVLSPHGEPHDSARARLQRSAPLLVVLGCALGGVLLVFFALKTILVLQRSSVEEQMGKLAAGHADVRSAQPAGKP